MLPLHTQRYTLMLHAQCFRCCCKHSKILVSRECILHHATAGYTSLQTLPHTHCYRCCNIHMATDVVVTCTLLQTLLHAYDIVQRYLLLLQVQCFRCCCKRICCILLLHAQCYRCSCTNSATHDAACTVLQMLLHTIVVLPNDA